MPKNCWSGAALAISLLIPLPFATAQTLPGTKPLTMEGDLAAIMVDGINAYLLKETAAAESRRAGFWKRDYSSREAYERSLAPNRERLRKMIGAVDPRVPVNGLEYVANAAASAEIAGGLGYRVYAVRWSVFDDMTAD